MIYLKDGSILLSQSTMKDLGFSVINGELEEFNICPYAFKCRHIDGIRSEESLPMTLGKYAETMMLGGGRGNEQTFDVPRLLNGDKRIEHKRIDQHIRAFPSRCEALGVQVDTFNTQIPLVARWSKNVWISGELDWFPVVVNDELAIIDMKYTKNAYNMHVDRAAKFSFECCYGNYEALNKMQPMTYKWLVKNIDMGVLKAWWKAGNFDYERFECVFTDQLIRVSREIGVGFYWFVIGSTAFTHPDEQFNFIKYHPIPHEEEVFANLVERSVNKFYNMEADGFPAMYAPMACRMCSVKLHCESFISNSR